MSRVISFRDLKVIPELSMYSEVQLLPVSMDALVNKYLAQLGFDLNCPVLYVPSKHRDMQNKVGVGFIAVGEINDDKRYLRSRVCPTIERLIHSAKRDMSLAKELVRMIGGNSNLFDPVEYEDSFDIPEDQVEADYEEVKKQIKILEGVRDMLRGSPYNEYGSLKTPLEYEDICAEQLK